MKPFLGIDLTTNKKNDQFNGSAFLIAQPSPALTQALDASSDNAEKLVEKSKLPLPIRIVQWICGVVGAVVVLGILKALSGEDSISLAEVYRNASWLFWLAGSCLLVWLILKIISTKKQHTVFESDEGTHTLSNLDDVCAAIEAELLVPKDAKEVDLLSFFYKVKDGRIKVCEKGMQIAPYFNLVFNVFADSENLYISNLEGKYAFPLSSVKAIHTIQKNIRIAGWNKEEGYNKGIYKQYKLTADDIDCIHCNGYSILEIDQGGESWGIYIPCYELPVFEELTGLKAQQQ